MAYRLDGIDIPVYQSRLDLEFKLLERSDFASYLALRPDASAQLLERRFALGCRCFTAWHDGELVDVCWAATRLVRVPYMNRDLRIPAGDIYSFDSFTAPAYRGSGAYMARNSFQARQNQREGFKRSIALVANENYTAWLILSRAGLVTLGTYHYLRLPARGIYWQTSAPDVELPQMIKAGVAEQELGSLALKGSV